MSLSVIDRILAAIQLREMTPRAASLAAGMSADAIRGITRNPDASPTIETIRKLAGALDVSPEWLAYGIGDGPEGGFTGAVVGVFGRIGAGGSIDTSSEQIDHAEPLFEVRVPFPVPDDALAFQVQGDSMWPRYDPGDVVVCSRFSENPDEVLGHLAAVETRNGERYLKRVLKGTRPGHYMLLSYNAPEMIDIEVVSFSSVIAVIPATQVSNAATQIRRSITRQVKQGKTSRA